MEEDIAVFVAAPHLGALRAQSTGAESFHRLHVAHLLKILIIPNLDFLKLMGSAEAVEEVQKWHAPLDRGQVGHRRKVHDFLGVCLGNHGKSGLAAGHHIGMVSKNAQGMACEGTRRYVKHSRQQLTRDFIHIRHHEQKALGCRIRGGEGARVQAAVDGAGSA